MDRRFATRTVQASYMCRGTSTRQVGPNPSAAISTGPWAPACKVGELASSGGPFDASTCRVAMISLGSRILRSTWCSLSHAQRMDFSNHRTNSSWTRAVGSWYRLATLAACSRRCWAALW